MWQCIKCLKNQINLKIVLDCGQSFRWSQKTDDSSVWIGVLKEKLWLLRQKADGIEYCVIDKDVSDHLGSANETSEEQALSNVHISDEEFLNDYFQLGVDIPSLYEKWSSVDENFKNLQTQFYGVRMLRQDPVENLFSFICSQNNNISRIKQLVNKLCVSFGQKIINYDGRDYYSFPSLSTLAENGVEKKLRELSFGYRAKFIQEAARCIEQKEGGDKWLYDLRKASYEEAHKGLCSLPGVGAKVSDCVCLMSLDKTEAIPVDTHMWQIAARDYMPHLAKNKTLTDRTYKEIGAFFRELHGSYAGWAHSVLFSADLKKFQELKTTTSGSKPSETKKRKAGKTKIALSKQKKKKKK